MTGVMLREERTTPTSAEAGIVRAVWTSIICGMAIASASYAAIAPRSSTGASPIFGDVGPGPVRALQLLVTVLVVGLAVLVVVAALPVLRTPRRGGPMTVGVMAVGSAVLVSGLFNGVKLSLGLLALPAVAMAMWCFPPPPLAFLERLILLSLRGIVWGSLASAIVWPAWATDRLYDASLLGLHSRLVGLTPHANALGPLAALLATLEVTRSRSRLISPALLVAAAALLWSQSKTSWVALGVVAVVAVCRRAGASSLAARASVAVVAAVIAVTAFAAGSLLAPGRATTKGDDTSETFTGRTAIWEATLEVFASSPAIGVGPRLWDDAMDRRFAHRVGFTAGHAHNQLIHTLGESGAVGECGLLLALGGFAALAVRADRATRGTAGAACIILFVTCFTEAPIRSIPFATDFFLVMSTYALALVGANEEALRDG